MATRLSIVIPTYRGGARLPAVLAALDAQTLDAADYEVIVADDASPDDTAEIAEQLGATVIRMPVNGGPSPARNAGWRRAAGTIVAFTDDDCVPDPDWAARILEAFADERVLGIGGHMEPDAPGGGALEYQRIRNPWTPLFADLLESASPLYRLGLYLRAQTPWQPRRHPGDPLYGVAGGNMAFRRAVLDEVGGFDEMLRVAEDTELCKRINASHPGGALVYWPAARVLHRIDASVGAMARRARFWGRGTVTFARDNDDVHLIAFPFPLLVGVVWLSALRRPTPRRLALAAAAPLLAYPRWPLTAAARRRPHVAGGAYLQLLQESATMAGELEGLAARR